VAATAPTPARTAALRLLAANGMLRGRCGGVSRRGGGGHAEEGNSKKGGSGGGRHFLKGAAVWSSGRVRGCASRRGGGGGSWPDWQAAHSRQQPGRDARGWHTVGAEVEAEVR
jgi:hypothetical protein